MNKSLFAALFVCTVIAMLSESAWAKIQATASWKINNNSITFRGLGGNNAEALEDARANCTRAQTIESWKNFCLNAPERLQYSTIPGGTYTTTCGTCGVRKEGEAEILVCTWCRPVMEERRLNLSQCPAEARDKIENCHGELICGVCNKKKDAPKLDSEDLKKAPKPAGEITVYSKYATISQDLNFYYFKAAPTPGHMCSESDLVRQYKVPKGDMISMGKSTQCSLPHAGFFYQEVTFITPD